MAALKPPTGRLDHGALHNRIDLVGSLIVNYAAISPGKTAEQLSLASIRRSSSQQRPGGD
jgi:hypothetical protein